MLTLKKSTYASLMGFFLLPQILIQLGSRGQYTKIWQRPWVEMWTMLSSSLLDKLIIKCAWPQNYAYIDLTKFKVLCNFRVTNKAWKTFIDSSSYDWDNFIWVSLEMALDQQTLEKLQEQNVGSDSSKNEFYECDDSLRYDW